MTWTASSTTATQSAFVDWLYAEKKEFLFLTNNSAKTQRELQAKLSRMGLDIDEKHFYTSALATAEFVAHQKPGARAFVIGEPGLLNALYERGITIDETDPDYVIVGESRNYTYDSICRAARCVNNGARLIGTNTDLTAPTEWGQVPACRALVAPIELATGKEAYYVGKPNPLMMRTGLNLLGVHSQDTAIIGDRMDTDIVAGIECGLDTVLVLSGVTDREGIEHFPYRPRLVLNGVGDIPAAAAQDRKDLVLLENEPRCDPLGSQRGFVCGVGYRWYSKSRLYRLTRSPSWMPISSSRSKRPALRSIRSNQLRDS